MPVTTEATWTHHDMAGTGVSSRVWHAIQTAYWCVWQAHECQLPVHPSGSGSPACVLQQAAGLQILRTPGRL